MFEGPLHWIHVASSAIVLMINLAWNGGDFEIDLGIEFNGTVLYRGLPSKRMCTTQDMDLLGGILSENQSKKDDSWVCPICLCEIQGADQELRELKSCKHMYHRECIDRWCLDTPLSSVKCPLCRGLVFEPQIDPRRDPAVVVHPTSVDNLPANHTLLRLGVVL